MGPPSACHVQSTHLAVLTLVLSWLFWIRTGQAPITLSGDSLAYVITSLCIVLVNVGAIAVAVYNCTPRVWRYVGSRQGQVHWSAQLARLVRATGNDGLRLKRLLAVADEPAAIVASAAGTVGSVCVWWMFVVHTLWIAAIVLRTPAITAVVVPPRLLPSLHAALHFRPYSIETALSCYRSLPADPNSAQAHVIVVQYHSKAAELPSVRAAFDVTARYAAAHRYGFVEGSKWYQGSTDWTKWPYEGPLAGTAKLDVPRAFNWSKMKLLASVMAAVEAAQKSPQTAAIEERRQAMLGAGFQAAIANMQPIWLLWLDADALLSNHGLAAAEVISAALSRPAMNCYWRQQSQQRSGALGSIRGLHPVAVAATSLAGGVAVSDSEAEAVDLITTVSLTRSPSMHHASDTFNAGMFFLRVSATASELMRDLWLDTRFAVMPRTPDRPYDQLEQGAMQLRMASGGLPTSTLLEATSHPGLRTRSDLTLGCRIDATSLANLTVRQLVLLREKAVEQSAVVEDADAGPSCTSLPVSRMRLFAQASLNTFPSSWDWYSDRSRRGDFVTHSAGDAWKDNRVSAYDEALQEATSVSHSADPYAWMPWWSFLF